MKGFVVLLLTVSAVLVAQQQPASFGTHEFPVTMRQNVIAGKTLPGTRVEARLMMATFLNGRVIPEGATFSGVVVESDAKSAAEPARLSVRMDSIRWGNGSVSIRAYVTAWYYPVALTLGEDRVDGFASGGLSTVHNSSSHFSPISPSRTGVPLPDASRHCVLMRNVETVRARDEGVALTSIHSNIKLDKTMVYVLAGSDPPASR